LQLPEKLVFLSCVVSLTSDCVVITFFQKNQRRFFYANSCDAFSSLLFVWGILLSLLASPVLGKAILPDFVPLVKELKPAVVNIGTTTKIKAQRMPPSPFSNSPFDEFFERFYEEQWQHKGMKKGAWARALSLAVTATF